MSDSSTQPRYSLVIPAYNEEAYLPRLLDSVDAARERFRDGADAIEVIVADNLSTDRTAEIASERGCRVARVEKRNIAASRNGGASIARGDVLCFVDADSRIDPDTFNKIDDAMATGNAVGGATGFRLERMSWGLWLTMQMVRLMVWVFRANGGVVFCRADAFREVGGYSEDMDFAEDVHFFRRMIRVGKRSGLRTVRDVKAPMVVSTRKFDRHGDWHMLYMPVWIWSRYGSVRALGRAYWYDDAR